MFFSSKQKNQSNDHSTPKDEYFDFDRISSYHRWKTSQDSNESINDHTWSDLDMDDIFMFIDRTHSKVGQQYLYHLLRTDPAQERIDSMEEVLSKLDLASKALTQFKSALKKLDSRGSYHLHRLFTSSKLEKPKWFGVVYLSFILTIASGILAIWKPGFILLTLVCLVINFIIHYWNKSSLFGFWNPITRLRALSEASKRSVTFVHKNKEAFNRAYTDIRLVVRKSSVLQDRSDNQNELAVVAELLLEIIKASLLIEPIMLYHLAEELDRKRNEVRLLFETIGFLDACLSVDALRKNTSWCRPTSVAERKLETKGCYHPLIIDPVSNDFKSSQIKSSLISGSNMSGKTTFIRTIGTNAILSKTINTAFAEEWNSPRFNIRSAIRISDNLLNDESFYQKEVKVIKEIVDQSEIRTMNLFLIDELYKGTNSAERIAAGVAVLSYISNDTSLVFASTHDLELTDLLNDQYENYHFTETVESNKIAFDYQLKEGKLRNTNAIKILESHNYPEEIIASSKNLLKKIR